MLQPHWPMLRFPPLLEMSPGTFRHSEATALPHMSSLLALMVHPPVWWACFYSWSVVDFYEFISLFISMCWFLVCFEALFVAFWHCFTKSASPDWVQSWSNSSMMDQSSEAPQLPCDIQNPPVIPGEYVFGTPKSAFLMRYLGSNYLLIRCLEA